MEVEWSGIRILIDDLSFSDGLSMPVVWFKYRIESLILIPVLCS